MNRLLMILAGVLVVCNAGRATAAFVTLNATGQGAYISSTGTFGTGGSGTASGDYLTGFYSGNEYRSFFTFDLSSVSGTVTSAALRIGLTGTSAQSPNLTETFAVFDVATGIPALVGGTGGVPAFVDLGTGVSFGAATVPGNTLSAPPGTVSVSLNSSALASITTAEGNRIALGGALTSLSGTGANEFVFGASGSTTQLVLEVGESSPVSATPAPPGLLLAISGIASLGGFGWLRRRSAAAA